MFEFFFSIERKLSNAFQYFVCTGKPVPVTPSSLVECSVCFDICHPHCVGFDSKDLIMNDDLPNSWECPQCNSRSFKSRQQKPRSRKMSISSAGSSAPTTDSERAMTPSKRSRPDQNEVTVGACYVNKIIVIDYIFLIMFVQFADMAGSRGS